jgi:H+/Cl- antiporter ClcA
MCSRHNEEAVYCALLAAAVAAAVANRVVTAVVIALQFFTDMLLFIYIQST